MAKRSTTIEPQPQSTLNTNLELEAAVLGACVLEAHAFGETVDFIHTPKIFAEPQHQLIYGAMQTLYSEGKPIDLHTVSISLRGVVMPSYIAKITASVASAANLPTWCAVLCELFMKREMVRIANEIALQAADEKQDAFDLMETAQDKIYSLNNNSFKTQVVNANEVFRTFIENIGKGENSKPIAQTGYPELDFAPIALKFKRKDLVIIAARPSMGKTAFALELIKAFVFQNVACALFSLEMSKESIIERMISNICSINSNDLDRIENIEPILQKTAKFTNPSLFYIDDVGTLTLLELRNKLKKLVTQNKVDIAVVDYLQLMSVTDYKGKSRENIVSEISRGLKAIAMDLDICIIALSQLSRALETRNEKRPILSDLRDSGGIEQDADIVMFLHRPEYYGVTQDENGESTKGVAEVINAKHRNGAIGTAKLQFIPQYIQFKSIEMQKYQYAEPIDYENMTTNDTQGGYFATLTEPNF